MARPTERPRLKDLASRAGVSIATASLALAGHSRISSATRDRVRSISADIGYKNLRQRSAQRALARGEAVRVGLFLLGDSLRSDQGEHHAGAIHRFIDLADAGGVRFEMGAIEQMTNPPQVLATLKRFAKGLGGVVLVGQIQPDHLALLHEMGVPCVVMGQVRRQADTQRALRAYRVQQIDSDVESSARQAVAWLFSRARRRIAFVSEQFSAGLYLSRWLDGYRLAHADAGVALDERLIDTSGAVLGGVAPAFSRLARLQNPPTAAVLPDARTAASFLDSARAAGHPLGLHDAVIGATPGLAAKYQVGDRPLLEVDILRMVDVCMEHLLHMRAQPPQGPLQVLVPMIARNMD